MAQLHHSLERNACIPSLENMVKTITRSKVIGFWCLDFKLAAETAAKELMGWIHQVEQTPD